VPVHKQARICQLRLLRCVDDRPELTPLPDFLESCMTCFVATPEPVVRIMAASIGRPTRSTVIQVLGLFETASSGTPPKVDVHQQLILPNK
jgi:hypothetical protein